MGCDVVGARCDGNWWRSEPLAHRFVQCARLDCGGVEPTWRTCVGFERTGECCSYSFHPPTSCARMGFSRARRSLLRHRRRTSAIRHHHHRVHVECVFPDRSPLQQMHPVSSCGSSPSAPHGPVSTPGGVRSTPRVGEGPRLHPRCKGALPRPRRRLQASLPRANPHEPGFNRRVKRNSPSNRTRTSVRSNPVETRRRWTNPKATHAEDSNRCSRGSSAGVVRFVGDSNPWWW